MKKPDGWKHLAWLRRILESDRFDSIISFEEIVWCDSNTLQPRGYYLFLITEISIHILPAGNKTANLNSSNSWNLLDIHNIITLNDTANFFGNQTDIISASKHIRIHVTDQIATAIPQIDMYTFYEDSTIYYYLYQTWQQANIKNCLK